jgi:hypothetical protein
VGAALEEHVLEQVGEPGLARPLVARADVIPEVDGYQREGRVAVQNDAQSVVQAVLGEGDVGGLEGMHSRASVAMPLDFRLVTA